MTLSEATEKYLHMLRVAGTSEKTIELREGILRRFAKYTGDHLDITQDDVLEYTEFLEGKGRQPSYINCVQSHLKRFYKWLVEMRLLEHSPFDGIKLRKVPNHVRRVDTDLIEKALVKLRLDGDERLRSLELHWKFAARNGDAWRKLRNWVLGTLSYKAGLRAGEALALRWRNVSFDEGTLNLEVSKTGPRTVPLVDEAVEMLRRWRQLNGGEDDDCVFPVRRDTPSEPLKRRSWAAALTKAGKRVGIRLQTHDLRRGTATKAVNGGADIDVVRAQLGHQSIITTQRYFTTNLDRLRQQMEAAFQHQGV